MDKKYLIFKEEFNCILELIDSYDSSFLSVYKNVVDKMYVKAIESIPQVAREDLISDCGSKDEFKITLHNYDIEYMYLETGCFLDIVRKNPFIKADVNIQAIYDENISYLNLFSLSIRNMKKLEDRLEIEYFQDENGNFQLIKDNLNSDRNAINFDWTVDLMREDDKYYLILRKWHRGAELDSKQVEINQEEVWDCLDIAADAIEDEISSMEEDDDDFGFIEDFDNFNFD